MTPFSERQDCVLINLWPRFAPWKIGKYLNPKRSSHDVRARAIELGLPPQKRQQQRWELEMGVPRPVSTSIDLTAGLVMLAPGHYAEARSAEILQSVKRKRWARV